MRYNIHTVFIHNLVIAEDSLSFPQLQNVNLFVNTEQNLHTIFYPQEKRIHRNNLALALIKLNKKATFGDWMLTIYQIVKLIGLHTGSHKNCSFFLLKKNLILLKKNSPKLFTPTCQLFYTDISLTFCNSAYNFLSWHSLLPTMINH